MDLQLITYEKEFENLQEEWNILLKNSDSDCIFLTWEWMNLWWETFHEYRRLGIITFRENGELIGIVPLLSRKFKYFGIFPVRRMEFLGVGENEDDEICSEYLNIITKKGEEAKVISGLIGYLKNTDMWDEINLGELSEENLNTRILFDKIKASNLYYFVKEDGNSHYINLPTTWPDLLNNLSPDFRKKINSYHKRLERKGNVEFKTVTDSQGLDCTFDKFICLHQKRWVSLGKRGCYASKKFTEFHRKLVKILSGKGLLSISLLEIDKNPVAARYDFLYNNRIYCYQSGFDPEFDKKISIGNVLRAYCLADYIQRGFTEYDFLKGDGRHKIAWAKNFRKIYNLKIIKKSWKGRICYIFNILKNYRNDYRVLFPKGLYKNLFNRT